MAAATFRIPVLVNGAVLNSTVETIVAKRILSRPLGLDCSYFRVCTKLESWYRLRGLAVAPSIPAAMNSLSGFFRIGDQRAAR